MPQNTTITLAKNTWTQITDANVAEITFQNIGGGDVFMKGAAGAVAPTDTDGAILYRHGEGDTRPLATLFPGISGVNRLYAICENPTKVMVSHA